MCSARHSQTVSHLSLSQSTFAYSYLYVCLERSSVVISHFSFRPHLEKKGCDHGQVAVTGQLAVEVLIS